MTITEYSKKIKNDYEEHIVLIKSGKFYRAFDYDTFIINYLFNYKTSSRDSIGLPIGNYTSQYFANIYLNELDYYIKFNLKIKYYCRYIDDFIILVKDKKEASYIYNLVEKFLKEKLKLKLNPKSKYFPNKEGCNFLGFVIHEDYILLNNKFKKKNI